ncbi:MAG: rod shape-determining protein RodA [bacterium]|nr:rod shape-determining protein RodA [bacterium]
MLIVLSGIGLIYLFSATRNMSNFTMLFSKQLFAVFFGFFCMFLFSKLDYLSYFLFAKYLYWLGIGLLLFVLIFGVSVRGAKSWLSVGIFSFQPAEFARFATIMMFCVFLEKNNRFRQTLTNFFYALLWMFPSLVLILMQPDFGAVLAFFPVLFGVLYVIGVRKTYLFATFFLIFLTGFIPFYKTWCMLYFQECLPYLNFWFLLLCFSLTAGLIYFAFKKIFSRVNLVIFIYIFFVGLVALGLGQLTDTFLKDYQRNRIMVFLNPEIDKLGAGYNVIQSKIAVGSGGAFGKGIQEGTQSQLGFLPERHTDFIFSVIAEEGGFLVAGIVLILFLAICFRMFKIALTARDRFGSTLSTAFLIMFAFFVILNIGFVLGLLPVTGVPLPFVSYGGSSFVMNSIIIGIMLNIYSKRHAN